MICVCCYIAIFYLLLPPLPAAATSVGVVVVDGVVVILFSRSLFRLLFLLALGFDKFVGASLQLLMISSASGFTTNKPENNKSMLLEEH